MKVMAGCTAYQHKQEGDEEVESLYHVLAS